jgi:DNA polymerase-3 subunit gamma/tau
MEPMPTMSAPTKPAKEVPKAAPVKEVKEKPAPTSSQRPSTPSAGNLDVTALRRMWPEVIESVKKKRRLTWSLLSASAQILSVDENHITIGIVNAGARDSFIRSESESILSDAFVEVTGMRRKIEVVVDPSADPYSPANMGKRTDEDPSDANQLAGTELIMKELGAQVIAESEK